MDLQNNSATRVAGLDERGVTVERDGKETQFIPWGVDEAAREAAAAAQTTADGAQATADKATKAAATADKKATDAQSSADAAAEAAAAGSEAKTLAQNNRNAILSMQKRIFSNGEWQKITGNWGQNNAIKLCVRRSGVKSDAIGQVDRMEFAIEIDSNITNASISEEFSVNCAPFVDASRNNPPVVWVTSPNAQDGEGPVEPMEIIVEEHSVRIRCDNARACSMIKIGELVSWT